MSIKPALIKPKPSSETTAVAGHLTLLVARTKGPFYSRPYPAPVLLGAILVTQGLAVLIVLFGFLVEPIAAWHIGLVWGYCIV